MTIKTFADSSAVSVAYALTDVHDKKEAGAAPTPMTVVPFTTEGFQLSKDAQQSQAITDSRRSQGQKNTKGTAEGSVTLEVGVVQFFKDMIKASLMSDWVDKTTYEEIHDGDIKQYMAWERVIKLESGAAKTQDVEQYFGMLVNEATLEIGDGDLMTIQLDLMGANGDYGTFVQGAGGLGGSIASAKTTVPDYETADGSNNIPSLVIKDAAGNPIEMTFGSASLKISNNARTQDGIGHVFAAGMAVGMVNVELSGDVFYYDSTVFASHMENKKLSAEFSIETADGRIEVVIPNLRASSPDANATGQNQDFSQSVTLTAHQGKVDNVDCVIRMRHYGANQVRVIDSVAFSAVDSTGQKVTLTVDTTNVPNTTPVSVVLSDQHGNELTDTGVITSNEFVKTDWNVSTLTVGDTLTAFVTVEGVSREATASVLYQS